MVPVIVDGQTVRLEMRIYKPARTGPVPTLVFNHGSTGRGRESRLFKHSIDSPALAQFFVQRGWAVVMPARRGRARSEGLYNEGFAVDRALGYTCNPAQSIPGADRALRDIAAAMDAILAMPFVDRDRVIIGGQSRGGILSVAYAGQHPEQVKGVINFVGGWLGTGCQTASIINKGLFQRGARYPGDTIWLYGDGDPFYSLSHSRKNFTAFQAAGGKGAFHTFPQAESIGHRLVAYPDVWASLVEAYLKRQGLPTRRVRTAGDNSMSNRKSPPNRGMEPTADSLRSAAASRSGSCLALDSFPTSDEVNNLDLISVFQSCLLPMAARHNRLVEFDCDSLRRQGQRIE